MTIVALLISALLLTVAVYCFLIKEIPYLKSEEMTQNTLRDLENITQRIKNLSSQELEERK